MKETLSFFEAKFTGSQKYLVPSQMKLYEHVVRGSNYAFAYYTEPFFSSHSGHYMAIRMVNEYKTIWNFDEFIDSVFSILPLDSADNAIFLIESFATHLYHYPETEAMFNYETDEFVAIWRTIKREDFFPIVSKKINLDSCHFLEQKIKQSLIEKWQMIAYGKKCEYRYYNLYEKIGLLESTNGNYCAYALFFDNPKPHIIELSDSKTYIRIYNPLNSKEYSIENLTYLFIIMEIINSPNIPNNYEKYELINKIKNLRKELE